MKEEIKKELVMARQSGVFKLMGLLGEISFYKTSDGFLIRRKGGVDAKRIASDPAFKRTRENSVEFANSARSGKVLRMAFAAQIRNLKDHRMVSRLTKNMVAVVKTDPVSERGKRHVAAGDLSLLKDFEFNIKGPLASTLLVPYTSSVDRTSGILTVTIAEFIPKNTIGAPKGATHCRFISAAAEIDFTNRTFIVSGNNSNDIALGTQTQVAFTLTNTVSADCVLPLFLALGIEFYQEVNGLMYGLNNGEFNCLGLIEVDGMIIH